MSQLCTGEARSAGFFAEYVAASNRCDIEALAGQFAETFLAGGRQASQAVRRENFLAFLPKRYQALQALGCGDAALVSLHEVEIDAMRLLAVTGWRIEIKGRSAEEEPIRVNSTFLLEEREGGWQILYYVAHDDLERLLKERKAGG